MGIARDSLVFLPQPAVQDSDFARGNPTYLVNAPRLNGRHLLEGL